MAILLNQPGDERTDR